MSKWVTWVTSAPGTDRRKTVLEPAAGGGEVVLIQDGRYHANALSARSQHVVQVRQVDSPDGEPRNSDIRRRPAHILQGDRSGGGLGASRINRTDPQIVRACGDGPSGLFRGGAAQPNPELKRAETAWISVGIDLALRSVASGYDGKGAISAGERVPLVMEVYDRLHPAATDLTGVFRHWGGPTAEATRKQ